MVCITFPSLSIIDILNFCFVAEMIENPSAEEQNTVPSVCLTGRANEADELTT